MDIHFSDDDVVEMVQTVVGVLADAEEITPERAAAILCEEHDGDGERQLRIWQQTKAALEHIFADRAMNDAKLGGVASEYMPDPTTGSPDCRSAE